MHPSSAATMQRLGAVWEGEASSVWMPGLTVPGAEVSPSFLQQEQREEKGSPPSSCPGAKASSQGGVPAADQKCKNGGDWMGTGKGQTRPLGLQAIRTPAHQDPTQSWVYRQRQSPGRRGTFGVLHPSGCPWQVGKSSGQICEHPGHHGAHSRKDGYLREGWTCAQTHPQSCW